MLLIESNDWCCFYYSIRNGLVIVVNILVVQHFTTVVSGIVMNNWWLWNESGWGNESIRWLLCVGREFRTLSLNWGWKIVALNNWGLALSRHGRPKPCTISARSGRWREEWMFYPLKSERTTRLKRVATRQSQAEQPSWDNHSQIETSICFGMFTLVRVLTHRHTRDQRKQRHTLFEVRDRKSEKDPNAITT